MTDDASRQLARHLAAAREDRGWTLARAAEQAEVSVAHLSRIEKGTRQPSVGMLIRLSRAYRMTVGELVGEEAGTAHHVIRADEIQQRAGADGTYAMLSGLLGNRLLEALRLELPAHTTTGKGSRHAGEEWLYVLCGAVRFSQGADVVDLDVHDAVHLDAQVAHHLQNLTDAPATVLLVTAGGGLARTKGHASA